MEVSIRVTGHFRRYLEGKHRATFAVKEGASLEEALQTWGFPLEQLRLIHLNGNAAEMTARLRPGDHIDVFAPVAGG